MKTTEKKIRWEHSSLGGGGYITGLMQNPGDPNIIYARCDVAGVFRSRDRGKSWEAVNNGMTACHHHSVQSFAVSPHNPDILFRCSGEARNRTLIGTVHRSTDGGSTWEPVCEEIAFYGNGPTRMYGEVIGVSPHEEDLTVTGGYSGGVWVSGDGGKTFRFTGLETERVGCITFHPSDPLCWYVGTIGDRVLLGKGVPENLLSCYHDYRRSDAGKLYRTVDGGKTYDLINDGLDFAEISITPDNSNEIIACCIGDRIMRSSDGGRNFESTSAGLPDGFRINSLCRDPHNPGKLLTAVTMNQFTVAHPSILPVYQSGDNGKNWIPLSEYDESHFSEYPDYIGLSHVGSALSKIRVDVEDADRLYVSNWYGVSVSADRGRNWKGYGFKGLETVCGEDIFVFAAGSEKPDSIFASLADHPPLYSRDNGKNYKMLDRIPNYSNSTACTASKYNKDLFLYGMRNRNLKVNSGCIVRKEGWVTEIVFEPGKGFFVQNLTEDPFIPGRFWASIDGDLGSINSERTAGIYRSDDWGKSFNHIPLPFPEYMKTLPCEKEFIESELLSVVVYQVKNVCGSNKTLYADPHKAGTVYFGEPTEGIFRTADSGETWKLVKDQLPFRSRKESVLTVVKGDPGIAGSVYAGFIREGLWHSSDFGDTWRKVFPADSEPFNVTGLDIGGRSGKEIVTACEPLYWSPVPSRVMWTGDLGKVWHDITDPALGALRYKGIAIEKQTGMIHGITCGNGCFRGVPE